MREEGEEVRREGLLRRERRGKGSERRGKENEGWKKRMYKRWKEVNEERVP